MKSSLWWLAWADGGIALFAVHKHAYLLAGVLLAVGTVLVFVDVRLARARNEAEFERRWKEENETP